jgi:hypothetical protein
MSDHQCHLQLLLARVHVGLIALADIVQLLVPRVLLEEHHVDERDQQVGRAMFRPGVDLMNQFRP